MGSEEIYPLNQLLHSPFAFPFWMYDLKPESVRVSGSLSYQVCIVVGFSTKSKFLGQKVHVHEAGGDSSVIRFHSGGELQDRAKGSVKK